MAPRGGSRKGAGRRPEGDKRDASLAGVRLPVAKLEAYKQAAELRGMTLTAWVEAACDAAAASKRGGQ